MKKGKKFSGRTWDSIIFWSCIFLGFALGGFMCYLSYSEVSNFQVWDEKSSPFLDY